MADLKARMDSIKPIGLGSAVIPPERPVFQANRNRAPLPSLKAIDEALQKEEVLSINSSKNLDGSILVSITNPKGFDIENKDTKHLEIHISSQARFISITNDGVDEEISMGNLKDEFPDLSQLIFSTVSQQTDNAPVKKLHAAE